MSDEWKLIIEGEEAYWYLEIGSSIITSNRFKIDLEEWKYIDKAERSEK